MKRQQFIFSIAAVLVMSLLMLAMPAAAQEQPSHTWTEEQVNEAARFDNTYLARFGPSTVDLQPGQMLLSGTFIPASTGEEIPFTTTLVPTIVDSATMPGNGNVIWIVTAVSVYGDALPDELVQQIATWASQTTARIIRESIVAGDVESVVITDNDITYFYSGQARPYSRNR